MRPIAYPVIALVLIAALIYEGITKAPVVAAVITGLLALATLVIERFIERRQQAERERREQLIPVYEQLIDRLLRGPPEGSNDQTIMYVFAGLSQKFLLWAPSAVITAFDKWRTSMRSDSDHERLLCLVALIVALRRDVGHFEGDLAEVELVRVFIDGHQHPLPSIDSQP